MSAIVFKSQLLAIVATLVYLFVVDPLLLALAPEAGKYLPPLQAAGLLVAIGAVFASVAIFTSLKRDID